MKLKKNQILSILQNVKKQQLIKREQKALFLMLLLFFYNENLAVFITLFHIVFSMK